MSLPLPRLFAAAIAAIVATAPLHAADITGAGSTFVYPILAKWSDSYKDASGNRINYQSIGSGGGIAQVKAGTVTFGASDKPLAPAELEEAGLAQFPAVVGGVVPVVHVADVAPGAMRFTGPLLADIYRGAVKRWNDPAIAAVNPGLSLPDQAITVVHRSDGSGTTFNFVNYLAKVSPAWKAEVGEGTSVAWPTGIGGKGNEGVAAYVRQVDGAIGYVELAYALQNGMAHAALRNAAGKFVQPNLASFQAAAASADWAGAEDFHLVITDAPGEASWPITASVFILVHRQPKDAAATALALDFFRWAWRNGADQAEALDYVPLPPALVERIEAYLARRIAS